MPSIAGIARSGTEAPGHGALPAAVSRGVEGVGVGRGADRRPTSVHPVLAAAAVTAAAA